MCVRRQTRALVRSRHVAERLFRAGPRNPYKLFRGVAAGIERHLPKWGYGNERVADLIEGKVVQDCNGFSGCFDRVAYEWRGKQRAVAIKEQVTARRVQRVAAVFNDAMPYSGGSNHVDVSVDLLLSGYNGEHDAS